MGLTGPLRGLNDRQAIYGSSGKTLTDKLSYRKQDVLLKVRLCMNYYYVNNWHCESHCQQISQLQCRGLTAARFGIGRNWVFVVSDNCWYHVVVLNIFPLCLFLCQDYAVRAGEGYHFVCAKHHVAQMGRFSDVPHHRGGRMSTWLWCYYAASESYCIGTEQAADTCGAGWI